MSESEDSSSALSDADFEQALLPDDGDMFSSSSFGQEGSISRDSPTPTFGGPISTISQFPLPSLAPPKVAQLVNPYSSSSSSPPDYSMQVPDVIMGSSGLLGTGLTRTSRDSLTSPGGYRAGRDGDGPEEMQSGPSVDDPDLIYSYDDSESLPVELAELYSYGEVAEFNLNSLAFDETWYSFTFGKDDLREEVEGVPWMAFKDHLKDVFMEYLLDQCERSEAHVRSTALRSLLYLLQGAFGRLKGGSVLQCATDNAFRLYKLGAWPIFVQLLLFEADVSRNVRPSGLTLADSRELRLICNILYSMVELIRQPAMDYTSYTDLRVDFVEELSGGLHGKGIFLSHLFHLFVKFVSGSSAHYPLKKLLLLIWKTVLVTCGGMDEARAAKNAARAQLGLPVISDDTLEVAKRLRASTPPLSVSEMGDGGNKRQTRPLSKYKAQPSSSKDGSEPNMSFWFSNVSESDDPPGVDDDKEDKEDLEVKHIEHPTRRTDSQPEAFTTRPDTVWAKGLPWTPKVRPEEIDRFIHQAREKFVGISLPEDTTTMVGLPKPIEDSILTLRKYVYVSHGDLQIKKEEDIARYPMSQKDEFQEDSAVERVYQALLPQMGNYVIGLLKVLLACSPTNKPKTESLNVIAEITPDQMPTTMVQTMKLGMDTNRHKEIMVKAISGIILLLLKHFKVNHVYQFETLGQHLVMANCMALILKFLNQNILGYVLARNDIPALNYPACVADGVALTELTKEHLDGAGDSQVYVAIWRNLQSCINLIRILNKLAKWKRPRILVLVLFKSAAILKRALRIRHPVMQLYTLKALKLQSKFLGRQWRRLNMKAISAIYDKVRHRFLDDWAYGNVPEHEVKRVDCHIEERKLRSVLDNFNNRRYHQILRPSIMYVQPGLEDFQPMDNSLAKALSLRVRIPDHFRTDYEGWLEREVMQTQIDWDQLIQTDPCPV